MQMQDPLPIRLLDKARLILRSKPKQGNFQPMLNTADEALGEAVEQALLNHEKRLMAIEKRSRSE